MNKQQLAKEIVRRLAERFPNPQTDLQHNSPFELLIATMLSAQCTDRQVNAVLPALFSKWPTPPRLSAALPAEVESIVRPCGFFRMKARNIILTAKMLTEQYNSAVPLSLLELIKLPGVGRKTAGCVLSAYGTPENVVVDTHVIRITNLLGIVNQPDRLKIELELMEIVERKDWPSFTHYLIRHGRATCIARRPKCNECCLAQLCASAKRWCE